MIAFSIALVIIAAMAAYLVNKFLDKKYQISIESAEAGTIAALEEQLKKFDQRINDTWGTVSSTKQELESLKMVIGLKGIK